MSGGFSPLAEYIGLTLGAFGSGGEDAMQLADGDLRLPLGSGLEIEASPVIVLHTSRNTVEWSADAKGFADTRYYWGPTRYVFRYIHIDRRDLYRVSHGVNESIGVRAEGHSEMINCRFYAKLVLNADEANLDNAGSSRGALGMRKSHARFDVGRADRRAHHKSLQRCSYSPIARGILNNTNMLLNSNSLIVIFISLFHVVMSVAIPMAEPAPEGDFVFNNRLGTLKIPSPKVHHEFCSSAVHTEVVYMCTTALSSFSVWRLCIAEVDHG
ncbi:hypothetical protein BV25DRAFT_1843734 [Artomyces pyxidatus]|uniref:Uncharacterized protein n=1 Tax=Artomyces pyxidatus TaxID=48021 RepID=A0ACB8SDJ2_9AGAM|nr:hypothetical protein BV25DRAFT_1843734 [Artomyces pyxidatus]